MGRFQYEVALDVYASHYPPPATFDEAITTVTALWPSVPKGKRVTFCRMLMKG